MECNEARAQLWPPERPRLVERDVAAARDHVRGCEACSDYFEQDRALLDLYDRIRSVPAPQAVRERVFDALARARWDARTESDRPSAPAAPSAATSRLRRFGVWPAVMVAALATVLFVELRSSPSSVEDGDVFVEDYLRRAVGQDHIETTDPAEVTRFLERELGVRVEPIRLAGLDVTRAEICLLEGRRGAMIVYKHDGAEVSHYLVPRERTDARAPAIAQPVGDRSAADMPVVTWATPNVEQALVGGVDADQLLQIAARGSSED